MKRAMYEKKTDHHEFKGHIYTVIFQRYSFIYIIKNNRIITHFISIRKSI